MGTGVLEKHNEVKKRAQEVASQETRVIKNMEIGQSIRQGDIYLTKVAEVPAGYDKESTDLQLAPGTSKGSRHILVNTSSLRLFVNKDANALTGPTIVSKETITLTHPEHAHFEIVGGGMFTVAYQRDFAQEELERVRD